MTKNGSGFIGSFVPGSLCYSLSYFFYTLRISVIFLAVRSRRFPSALFSTTPSSRFFFQVHSHFASLNVVFPPTIRVIAGQRKGFRAFFFLFFLFSLREFLFRSLKAWAQESHTVGGFTFSSLTPRYYTFIFVSPCAKFSVVIPAPAPFPKLFSGIFCVRFCFWVFPQPLVLFPLPSHAVSIVVFPLASGSSRIY